MNHFIQILRSLRKRPLQSLVILSIIAAGVGASSAFYSVSEVLLLHPLSFDPKGRLVDIQQRLQPSGAPLMNSQQNLNELREQSKMLDGVATYKGAYGSITANGKRQYVEGMLVDHYFFSLLGIRPFLGRGFTAEDEQDGAPCTIVLSHAFWQRYFAGDPSILDKNVLLDKKLCTITGIMPQSFSFPFTELATAQEDFWQPIRNHASSGNYDSYGIGRIKEGVSLRQARAEALGIATHISRADKGQEAQSFLLLPYREVIVADYIPMLSLLGGILACVLLVVCINVASLLLADGLRDRKEVAIRFALGGMRWQIVRVFLFRVLTLAFAGGLIGIALAWTLVDLTRKFFPDGFPDADQIRLNANVLWFAAGTALGVGVLSGTWPALAATQKLHRLRLSGANDSVTVSFLSRSRNSLVVLQLAFSAAFLVVTALLGVSLYRLLKVDPGMQLDHRLVVMLRPADSGPKTGDELRVFFSRIEQQLLSMPGVKAVAVSSDAPLGAHSSRDFRIRDVLPPRNQREWIAQANAIGPNYFQELGISLRQGRFFSEDDRTGGKPVAIVNELFGRRFFGTKSPLGKQICVPSGEGCLWREIVGVVANVRDGRIDNPAQVAYFLPFSQAPREFLGNAAFTAWTNLAPTAVRESVQKQMSNLGSALMMSFTLEELRSRQTVAPRARVYVLAAIAGIAVLLAAMGVYGIVAGIVEQRRREIGIRIALGASPQTITALFVRNVSVTLVSGLLLGLTGAAITVRSIASILFETSPLDPAAYLLAALVLSVVATFATCVPVLLALQENPGEILRSE